jgi:hypothetical protein
MTTVRSPAAAGYCRLRTYDPKATVDPACPLSAKSGHSRCSKKTMLFDHLVGADHQRQRHVDAEVNERRHPGYFPA